MGKLSKKAAALTALLERTGALRKSAEAQEQKVEEKKLLTPQTTIGNQMQNETESGTQGKYASDPNVDAEVKGLVEYADTVLTSNMDSKYGEDGKVKKEMAQTGTPVRNIDPNGGAQGTPSQVVKSAALRQKLNACIGAELRKSAALQQQEAQNGFITATSVMQKVAALTTLKDQNEIDALTADIDHDFVKLAKYNPLFQPARENALMRKVAEEVEALAEEEGIPPEQAAEALDAATASDPAAIEELGNEVDGEALSDLAGAEQDTADLMAGLEDTAAQVSEATGTPISADDIIGAVQEVVDQAEQMGVEPEALIEAAAEQMMLAEGSAVTPEDEAAAEQLMQEAAAQGVSPEEVIQAVAGEVGGEPAAAPEAAPEAPAEDPEMAKEASFHKQATLQNLCSTRRGANLAKILKAAGR